MAEAVDALILELLEWIACHRLNYAQVLEVWRSTCPRHTTWEDACSEGLIQCTPDASGGAQLVGLTPKGLAVLSAHLHANKTVAYATAQAAVTTAVTT